MKKLDAFLKHLDMRGLSERRRKKYRVFFGKHVDIEKPVSKESCEEVFLYLKHIKLKDSTKEDYWHMFRLYAKWANPKLDLSEYRLMIKKKRKMPEEILSIDEVKKLVVSYQSLKNRAIVSMLFDLGCRPSELLGLKYRDVTFDENGLVVSLDGKTGMRRIRVITTLNSARFLKEWMLTKRYTPDDLIFGHVSIERLNQIVKEQALKIGITKKVYSYIFRHSRATFLAKYLTEQQMKVYLGWAMDSKMVGIYVHLSGRDMDDKVMQLNGQEVTEAVKPQSTLEQNLIQTVLTLSQELAELKKTLNVQKPAETIEL